jgi:hypothetical protein
MKAESEPMAHVKFIADYIFTPDEDRRTSRRYPEGWHGLVRRQCADKAIAAGKAVAVTTPRRKKPADE